jgi:hypothetical protein
MRRTRDQEEGRVSDGWSAAIAGAGRLRVDVVPPEWKSVGEIRRMIAEADDVNEESGGVSRKWKKLRESGILEERRFRILRGGGSSTILAPHYRLKSGGQ